MVTVHGFESWHTVTLWINEHHLLDFLGLKTARRSATLTEVFLWYSFEELTVETHFLL
jgi:hypothetical protein